MKRDLKGLVKRGVGQSTQRPNDPIEKIMLSAVGLSRQPRHLEIDTIAAKVSDAAKPLLGIAMSGNVHAIRKVTELASTLCSEAMMLACMHQEAANEVARERTSWPLSVPAEPAERRRALRLITGARKLPLGGKAPAASRRSSKSAGYSSPANAAVLVAMKAIQIERTFRVPSELFPTLQPEWSSAAARLPDLDGTAAVADQWFNVIWMYVCQRHGGNPESSALGRLAEMDRYPAHAHGSHDTSVRAGIRHALRAAFDRMARKRTARK